MNDKKNIYYIFTIILIPLLLILSINIYKEKKINVKKEIIENHLKNLKLAINEYYNEYKTLPNSLPILLKDSRGIQWIYEDVIKDYEGNILYYPDEKGKKVILKFSGKDKIMNTDDDIFEAFQVK